MLKIKIEKLVENRHKIPDEFWVDGAFWFHDQNEGGYDWNAERLGINKDGEIVWAFDSGCSCNSPWEDFKPAECTKIDAKKFVLKDFFGERGEYSELKSEEDFVEKEVDEYLMLIEDNLDPKKVLTAMNAEVRRYLIKRVGYQNIKDEVKAEVLHVDGDNELLKFANGEMYVKVKDSSTDREYLLYVEGRHTTCKSAIAWTFGLTEVNYNPIIET